VKLVIFGVLVVEVNQLAGSVATGVFTVPTQGRIRVRTGCAVGDKRAGDIEDLAGHRQELRVIELEDDLVGKEKLFQSSDSRRYAARFGEALENSLWKAPNPPTRLF
jgi:hypothetical protein